MAKGSSHKLHTRIPARIILSSGDKVTVNLVELSLGGATIEYPVAADKGTVLTLQFHLPIKLKNVPVQVKAEVVGNYLHHRVFEISLRFRDMREEDRKILQEYLKYLQNLRRS